jgi:hypothetical protein
MGSVLVMLVPLALHAAEPEDIIKYRQNMMKAIGGTPARPGQSYKARLITRTSSPIMPAPCRR